MNLQTKKRAQASPVTITKLRDLCKENVPCFKNCSSALVYTRVKYCLDKNNISVFKDRATNKPYCNLTSEKLQKLYKKLNEKYSLPEQQNEKKIAFSTKSLMKEVLEGSREECVTSGYCVSGKSYVYRGIYWQILPALENGLIEKQEGKQKEMILLASKTVYLNLVNKCRKMKKSWIEKDAENYKKKFNKEIVENKKVVQQPVAQSKKKVPITLLIPLYVIAISLAGILIKLFI